MPAISDCQCLLQALVQHAHQLQAQYFHQSQQLRLRMSDLPLGSDDSDSDDSSSSSSTSTTSSSNSNDSSATNVSTLSSKAEVLCALQTAWNSYFWSASCVRFFLSVILSTCVIFPHEVTKCSQLGLILLCYKEDDAPAFIEISKSLLTPSTSSCPSSKTAPASRTTLQTSKWPSHLNLPSPCFGSVILVVASMDAVAQWAGCSTGAIINSTHCVIRAFLLLHDQAI